MSRALLGNNVRGGTAELPLRTYAATTCQAGGVESSDDDAAAPDEGSAGGGDRV